MTTLAELERDWNAGNHDAGTLLQEAAKVGAAEMRRRAAADVSDVLGTARRHLATAERNNRHAEALTEEGRVVGLEQALSRVTALDPEEI